MNNGDKFQLYRQLIYDLADIIEFEEDIRVHAWTQNKLIGGSHIIGFNDVEYFIDTTEWLNPQHDFMHNLVLDKYHSLIPHFVFVVFHEMGHAYDGIHNVTGFAGLWTGRKNEWMEKVRQKQGKRSWYLYRMGYHEKYADMYAVKMWEKHFDEIVKLLKKYDKLGLPYMFD